MASEHRRDDPGPELSIGSAGLLRGGAVARVSVEVPETITTPEGIAFRPNLLACTWHDGSLATTYERVVANVVCDNTVARVPQQAHPAADRLSAQRSIAAAGIVYSVARTYCHGVLRDLDRLRWAAARVQDDLRRTTGRLWSCVVGDDYVMSVTEGRRVEQVLLEAEVEEEEWFLPSGLEASELDGSLDADADEVVVGDTARVLRVMGIRWPVCAEHGGVLEACSGWWLCDSGKPHDVAAVGLLESRAARSEPPY